MVRESDLLITFMDQKLVLTSEKAIYWKNEDSLIVTDLHLGKSGHFRKAGIPVSSQVNNENLSRLEFITSHFNPETIYFLGDLFHSEMNIEWKDFEIWRSKNSSISMKLVLGNHDFYAVPEYEKFNLECFHQLEVYPFTFIHDVSIKESYINELFIGGHIHPSIRFKGKGRQSLKVPCFFFSKNKILLPAFGSFTGTHNIKPTKRDLVFPILDGKVIDLNDLI